MALATEPFFGHGAPRVIHASNFAISSVVSAGWGPVSTSSSTAQVVLGVWLALVLVACSSGGSDPGSASPTGTKGASATPTTAPFAIRDSQYVLPDPLPAEAPVARITLTRAAILSARTLTFALSGQDKRTMFEMAIKDGAKSTLPVGRVLADSEQAIDIHWSAE